MEGGKGGSDYKKIESHSSYLNNQRLNILFLEADKLALECGKSMHITAVTAYYEAVEHIYLCIEKIVQDKEAIDDIRKKYARILYFIESDPTCRTRKALVMLNQFTKQFFSQLHGELQRYEFFFRISISQPKGLNNIRFFDKSMFNMGGKEDESQGENDTGSG
jgi:hypothetical protein